MRPTAKKTNTAKFSNYELKERLDALYRIKNVLYDYRHVFNHEQGDYIIDTIVNEITLTVGTLDNRLCDF